MRFARLRFSVRTLLLGVAVIAALLGLSVRFGPHLLWRTVHSKISSHVVAIPSKLLVAEVPGEELQTCHVGPLSFDLPQALAKNIVLKRGIGGVFLQFHDDRRSLAVQLPKRDYGAFQSQIERFPEKSKLTFPRLYKEIFDAQSSDFSFAMSPRQLQWHKWLLTRRSLMDDADLVEYVWGPDIEGVLVSRRSTPTFQWVTIDGKWAGTVLFKDRSPDKVDWVRHACSTFRIDGDAGVFGDRDDEEIKSMVTFSETAERGGSVP